MKLLKKKERHYTSAIYQAWNKRDAPIVTPEQSTVSLRGSLSIASIIYCSWDRISNIFPHNFKPHKTTILHPFYIIHHTSYLHLISHHRFNLKAYIIRFVYTTITKYDIIMNWTGTTEGSVEILRIKYIYRSKTKFLVFS